MLVKVYGSKSPRLKALLHNAVKFAALKLMSKRLCNSLEISVKFDKSLMKNDGAVAQVEWVDNNYKARIFEITLDRNQSAFLQILSIMHEMVHIKQYAKGELMQSLKNCKDHKWQKVWVDDSKINYYDLPWEIEAHGREKGMTLEWLRKTDLMTETEKEAWRDKFLF